MDEPEISLHHKFIDKMSENIIDKSKKIQFLLATHSSRLLKNILKEESDDRKVFNLRYKNKYTYCSEMKLLDEKRQITFIEDEHVNCYFSDMLILVEGESELELLNNKYLKVVYPFLKNIDIIKASSNKVIENSLLPNKKWFYKKIKYILQENGFKSNYSKRRMETEKLSLGGFVVEEEIALSRKKLNNINKILYYFKDKENHTKYTVDKNLVNTNCLQDINELGIMCNNGKERKFENMSQLINYLCGYRSFLIEIINSNDDSKSGKMKNLQNKINQIEKVVKQINLI